MNELERNQAFDGDIQFGTAGLRGIMGLGSNRINVYTIRQVTQAVANYLLDKYPNQQLQVVVSYDNRHNSRLFADTTAGVLSNNNIKCMVFDIPTSTPILAYATRHFGCTIGIMITASHNSSVYSGYKIFDNHGVQLIDTTKISQLVQAIEIFDVPTISSQSHNNTTYIGQSIVDSYLDTLATHIDRSVFVDNHIDKNKFSMVYTPLNGTGCNIMPRMLTQYYNCTPYIVPEQNYCDGDFATCPQPNPEYIQSFELAIEVAKSTNADIILATDPDADRVGAMALHNGEYRHINGNEMGILLAEYLLSSNYAKSLNPHGHFGKALVDPIIIRTVVTTNLVDKIAKQYNAKVLTTLTGFKYIGNIARQLSSSSLVLGFEESMGYLSGNHIGDKDAYIATALIVQLASLCKSRNITLIDQLYNIFERYGHFSSSTQLVKFESTYKIEEFMSNLRLNHHACFGEYTVQQVCDYVAHEDDLMRSNMIVYQLDNDVELIFRPSGTEPLLKVYILSCISPQCNNTVIDNLTQIIVDMTK
jgi:phosphoglucomutase